MICRRATLFPRPSNENKNLINSQYNISNHKLNDLPKFKNIDQLLTPIIFLNKIKKKKLYVDKNSLQLFNNIGYRDFKNHWSTKVNLGIFYSEFNLIVESVTGLKKISQQVINSSTKYKKLSKIILVPIDKTYDFNYNSNYKVAVVNMSGRIFFPKKNQKIYNCLIFILNS